MVRRLGVPTEHPSRIVHRRAYRRFLLSRSLARLLRIRCSRRRALDSLRCAHCVLAARKALTARGDFLAVGCDEPPAVAPRRACEDLELGQWIHPPLDLSAFTARNRRGRVGRNELRRMSYDTRCIHSYGVIHSTKFTVFAANSRQFHRVLPSCVNLCGRSTPSGATDRPVLHSARRPHAGHTARLKEGSSRWQLLSP